MSPAESVVVSRSIQIPRSELVLQFSRSSGPGGQNVNKVNSRVQVRWDIDATQVLTETVCSRLKSLYRRRINAAGELVVVSQRFRDRSRNIQDCLEKLCELVREASKPVVPRRPTRPTAGSKQRRLGEKRRVSQRKQSRRPPGIDD